jgi:hypothetical protein
MVTSFAGVRQPTNRIVERGDPNIQELKLEIASGDAVPGRWCVKGTNDDDIQIKDGNTGQSAHTEVVGFLGFEHTKAADQPSAMTTAYAVGDEIAVINGPGTYILAWLSLVSAGKGELLTAGHSGMLTVLATAGQAVANNTAQLYPVAKAMETVAAAAANGVQRCVVELLI